MSRTATSPPDPVAGLVAWHNRHPLARRITPAEVHEPTLLALPFAAAAPTSAAAPSRWRPFAKRRVRLRALFGQETIPGLDFNGAVAFVARPGSVEKPAEQAQRLRPVPQ